jgi:hypothetical protein
MPSNADGVEPSRLPQAAKAVLHRASDASSSIYPWSSLPSHIRLPASQETFGSWHPDMLYQLWGPSKHIHTSEIALETPPQETHLDEKLVSIRALGLGSDVQYYKGE